MHTEWPQVVQSNLKSLQTFTWIIPSSVLSSKKMFNITFSKIVQLAKDIFLVAKFIKMLLYKPSQA